MGNAAEGKPPVGKPLVGKPPVGKPPVAKYCAAGRFRRRSVWRISSGDCSRG
jgi:hypothetical protein